MNIVKETRRHTKDWLKVFKAMVVGTRTSIPKVYRGCFVRGLSAADTRDAVQRYTEAAEQEECINFSKTHKVLEDRYIQRARNLGRLSFFSTSTFRAADESFVTWRLSQVRRAMSTVFELSNPQGTLREPIPNTSAT